MKMKFWVKGGFNQTPSKFAPWLHMTKQSGAVSSEKEQLITKQRVSSICEADRKWEYQKQKHYNKNLGQNFLAGISTGSSMLRLI